MFYLEMRNYLPTNFFKNSQKEFFISNVNSEQAVLTITTLTILPVFTFSLRVIPRNLFLFSGGDSTHSTYDNRFKMILWSIIAGTRGGVNRAKILNLVKDTPMNANKIATVLSLDHKTVIHHVKILSKNELIIKADKEYGAKYQLTEIMKENQSVLEEIMLKIGTK